ncbi:CPCC family cysteine-rich protein [Paenibacillus sp. sgz5001063]|uniref:CPCC family cysteine-rich protein n=1 Tax=Paenibacillus sp. sgz5001063 TaxID=3242474 RepID=UPI0036D258AB
MKKYTCPCCGYMTLDEQPTGTYEICKICFWEDDGVQFDDPDYEGGANKVSLRQGQKNFIEFGACEERCIQFVRKPNDDDVRDPHWLPLSDVHKINFEEE